MININRAFVAVALLVLRVGPLVLVVLVVASGAGRVLGAGRLDITNGSRRILGTQGDATYTDTSFKRYFKVGDVIRVLDTNTHLQPSTSV